MDYLNFLKYGAIGVSLALAIFSYRLLSREQDKPEVRLPILNTIKLYFGFALALSLFFGMVEFFTLGKKSSLETAPNEAIDRLWAKHFKAFPDTTLEQKVDRIGDNLSPEKVDTAAVCREFIRLNEECQEELDKLQEMLKDYDRGFYQNVIKLQKLRNKDNDGWINITFQPETKQEVYQALRDIFTGLRLESKDYHALTDQQIIEEWRQFKRRYAADKDLVYIYNSDISVLVRSFLDNSSNL